jgi:hypothetical protein
MALSEMPDICSPGECLKERLMELIADQKRDLFHLQEEWEKSLQEITLKWDAVVEKTRHEMDLVIAATKIDPDTLARLLGQREVIASLKKEMATLRREIEVARGVRRTNGSTETSWRK